MGQIDWRDVGIRALKSGIQAFIAVVGPGAVVGADDVVLKAGVVAAATAVVATVWNALLQYSRG